MRLLRNSFHQLHKEFYEISEDGIFEMYIKRNSSFEIEFIY